MKLTLKIEPDDKVIGSMPLTEVHRTPVLLGLEARGVDDQVEFLLDVVFQSIRIARPLGRGHWYIAVKEADIELWAKGAEIKEHSKGPSITVSHETTETKERGFTAEIKPEIEISEDVKVSVASIGATAKGSQQSKLQFSNLEYPLTAAVRGDSILWQQSMTQDHNAIRDFIFGNTPLSAKCKWPIKDRHGSVEVKTSAVYFNAKGRPVSAIKSLLAEFVLDRKSLIADEDGIKIQFTCADK